MINKQHLLMGGMALLTCTLGKAETMPMKKTNAENVKSKPNILFIIADQWRKQALGYMNEDPVKTPNLDALSKWAVSFDNTFSSNPVSGPNRACIFTGKYTINNGLWANGASVDPKEPTAMGTIFKKGGYDTGYIGKWHMNGIVDMVADPSRRLGFDYWYQSLTHSHFKIQYYAPEIDSLKPFYKDGWSPTWETDVAIDYMKKDRDKPFCLVVSYGPPHTGGGPGYEDRYQPGKIKKFGYGYAGPAEYEAWYKDDYNVHHIRPNVKPTGTNRGTTSYAHAVPGYFGAVSSLDHEIGRLILYLEKSGKLDNTIIVFTADHGEMMGSHGLMTKGVPFEESEGVPMLFAWKGKIAPARHTCVFSSIDIVPTLSALVGLNADEADGVDYSPLLLGKKFKEPKYVFTEFNFGGVGEKGRPWRAVFSEDYVYILAGPSKLRTNFIKQGYVLYDRKKDPYQIHPVTKGMGYDKVIDKYHKILVDHLAETGDRFISEMWNVSADKLPMKPYLHKDNFDPNLTKKALNAKKKGKSKENRKK